MKTKIALFGTGYGATYLPGILASRRAELVAIGSRGSAESRELAQELEVPLFTDARKLLQATSPDAAIVAIPKADPLIRLLVKAGVRVLAEHPISAAAARLPFLVNAHFYDLPAPRRFLEACQKAKEPRAIILDVDTRALYSALDIVHRALGRLELRGLRATVAAGKGWPPAAVVGTLNGLPFTLSLPAGDAAHDDGHVAVGHRISIAYARDTITLVDTYGPVVRANTTKPLNMTWAILGTSGSLSYARVLRGASNARAVAALVAGKRAVGDVERTHDVARACATLRRLVRRPDGSSPR